MTSPVEIQAELEAAAKELDAASTKLAQTIKAFEGSVDEEGEYRPGPGVRYETAKQAKLIGIYEEAVAEERRPPAEDIRAAMAERYVRESEPVLWEQYQSLQTEMKALQVWISARKQSISARQSVLKGERG